jgi:hypothetical protein
MTKKKRTKHEHRSLTPSQVKRQQQGGEYLMPGVWIDREGGLHFSIPEILKAEGIADTPEAREHARRMFEEMLREQQPQATIIVQDDEKPDS